ncbi:Spo0E family sporulation regulatory protein-aspartic acid phosphatase [Alteribacillus sp. JSM 102045]|uniref:Spo0E family sporulation regulatory protein-aspartic acid phosphatase n=1 Tax=Alteribacillus sp. JSM 102045 TaxID=1562101 RepID=UPI0035C00D9B
MGKNVFTTLEEKELESLRQKMIEAAELHGIEHPLVLHYSQKVDQKHNKLLELKPKNKSLPSVPYSSQRTWQII